MRIPSDIKVNIPAPRPGLLEALGLRVGQTVSAQVVGQAPGGGTTVQIGNQQITLNLPLSPPPQPGEYLQFQLTSGGLKPQLTLLAGNGKAPQGGLPQQAGQPAAQQPAVTVTTSNAPPPQGLPAHGAPNQQQAVQQTPQNAGQPPPGPAPVVSTPQPPVPTSGAPLTPAPAASNLPGIPLPQSVQTELNLQPGQLVTARVVPPAANGQPQIAIGNQTIQASLPGNPPPGTILQFQADASGTQPRLVLLGQGEAQPRQVILGTLRSLNQSPVHPAPPPASHAANSPQQAIAQTAASAVARQDSVGALLLSLAGLREQSQPLPNAINAVARQLLGQQLDLSRGAPNAEALRVAVAGSGIFFEAGLANSSAAPQPQGDSKALLMLLRNMLGNWLGKPDSGLPAGDRRPPPPMKGTLPRAQLLQGGQLAQDASAQETARHLLQQTDSALSRIRLFQLSSLPDGGARAAAASAQEWNFELPMLLNGQLSMAQFQITRDPEEEADPAARGWHMVFSIHFGRIGEVGARIAWRARKTSVMLWAEEEETAAVLEENIADLATALEAVGLEPGSVRVRRGHPDSPPPRSGGFVDESS